MKEMEQAFGITDKAIKEEEGKISQKEIDQTSKKEIG